MADHPGADALRKYRERSLSPEELLATADHIATCELCRSRLQSLTGDGGVSRLQQALAGAADEPEAFHHLDAETLGQYVDNTLSDVEREIAEGHIESCARCSAEAEDLVRFRAVLSTYPAPDAEAESGVRRDARRRIPVPGWLWAVIGTPAVAAVLAATYIAGTRSNGRTEMSPVNPGIVAARPSPVIASPERSVPAPIASPGVTPDLRRQIAAALVASDALKQENARLKADLHAQKLALASVQARNHSALAGAELASDGLTPAAKASLATLLPESAVLRGGDSGNETVTMTDFGPISPANRRVQSARPVFRWKPLMAKDGIKDGTGDVFYVVRIFEAADFAPVAESGPLKATEWTPDQPLPRGKTYVWQIAARTKSGEGEEIVAPKAPAPDARFAILSDSEEIGLEAALRVSKSDFVAQSRLYTQFGLFEEAKLALDKAAAANRSR